MKEKSIFAQVFGDCNKGCRYIPSNCGRADQLPPCVTPPSVSKIRPNFWSEWHSLELCAKDDARREICSNKGCEPMRKYHIEWHRLYMKAWHKLNPAPPTNDERINMLENRVSALEAALAEKVTMFASD